MSDAIVDVAERAATDNAPPEVDADATPAPDLEAALLRHKVPDGQGFPPESPAPAARTIPEGDTAAVTPPKASHGPAPAMLELETQEPSIGPPPMPQRSPDAPPPAPAALDRTAPTASPRAPFEAPPSGGPEREPDARLAEPEPPVHRRGRPAAPAYTEKPKRRVKAPARRRPRQAPDVVANGVSPAQAHARKGVCFAYFLNHECWRVPDAYCNSALQVCITRECPIYHLHRDALERRFARKFKHFW